VGGKTTFQKEGIFFAPSGFGPGLTFLGGGPRGAGKGGEKGGGGKLFTGGGGAAHRGPHFPRAGEKTFFVVSIRSNFVGNLWGNRGGDLKKKHRLGGMSDFRGPVCSHGIFGVFSGGGGGAGKKTGPKTGPKKNQEKKKKKFSNMPWGATNFCPNPPGGGSPPVLGGGGGGGGVARLLSPWGRRLPAVHPTIIRGNPLRHRFVFWHFPETAT